MRAAAAVVVGMIGLLLRQAFGRIQQAFGLQQACSRNLGRLAGGGA
jgi:hypothetical protein